MRGTALPPVKVTNGHHIRLAISKAISELETYAKRATALPAAVTQYEDFITAQTAAITAIKAYPASIVASAVDVALVVGSDDTEQIVVTKTPLSGSTSNVAADTANTSYTSSDVAVLTVSATGLVTAVGAGSATVLVTHKNKTSAPLAFTVTV